MAADDLVNFPTPAEAFGRNNSPANQRRHTPVHHSSSSSLQSQQSHARIHPQHQQQQQQRPSRLPPPPLQQQQHHHHHQQQYQQQPVQQRPPPPPVQQYAPQQPPVRAQQPQQHYFQQQQSPVGHRVTSGPSGRSASAPQVDMSYNQAQPPAQNYSSASSSYQQPQQGYPPEPLYSQPVPQTPSSTQSVPSAMSQQNAAQVLERQLRDIFDRADRNRDGKLTEEELGSALLNNDGSQFKSSTLRLMIRLFDTDDSSTIEFKEFYDLWTYLLHWRKTYQRYDVNQNGRISFGEYQAALESFGYRLPTDIVLFVFQKFGDFHSNKPMSLRFDMFVESLIWLLRCTNIFKKFDTKGNGMATIPFQDFVHEFISFI